MDLSWKITIGYISTLVIIYLICLIRSVIRCFRDEAYLKRIQEDAEWRAWKKRCKKKWRPSPEQFDKFCKTGDRRYLYRPPW